MSKISPCLWFDGEAEEAAKFYVSLLPDSRIETVQKNTVDSPGGKAGSVLVVEFTLAGQRFMALNGGMRFEYTHAVSFKIDCADQAEVDRLWDGLCADGGQAGRCGWLKDRFGVSWQIVPSALVKYLGGPDRAGAQRAMQAMLKMNKLEIAGLKGAYEASRPLEHGRNQTLHENSRESGISRTKRGGLVGDVRLSESGEAILGLSLDVASAGC